MPTIDLKVQVAGNEKAGAFLPGFGAISRWTAMVGATEPHKCVNDSATTTHDGDDTYLLLTAPCYVNFQMFRMSEHWQVESITLRAVIKAPDPDMEMIWFMTRNDTWADNQIVGQGVVGAYPDYTLLTNTVTVNPWTGLPFTAEELLPVEVGFIPIYPDQDPHEVRLTLMSAQVTYSEPTNGRRLDTGSVV